MERAPVHRDPLAHANQAAAGAVGSRRPLALVEDSQRSSLSLISASTR
jgi:hypothetical protein